MNKKEYIEEYKNIVIIVLLVYIILLFGVMLNMLSVVMTAFYGVIVIGTFWLFQTFKLIFKGELK